MVREAGLEETTAGRAPATDGWFVVSVAAAAWVHSDRLGSGCVFVGAGERECVIFMAGAPRAGSRIEYPRCATAIRHGAGVEVETDAPAVAYLPHPEWRPWPPGERRDPGGPAAGLLWA